MRPPFPPLLLLPLLFGACQTCPPQSQALVLAPNFQSPESTGRSFFAALACNDAGAEYRCFGESLKEHYGATLDLYLLARPEIRADLGVAAGQAWRLQPLRSQNGEPDTILWWGWNGHERVGLRMTAQYYFDITEADGRRSGSLLQQPPADFLRIQSKRLVLELSDPVLRSVGENADIRQFVIGTEWKIADILLPQDATP